MPTASTLLRLASVLAVVHMKTATAQFESNINQPCDNVGEIGCSGDFASTVVCTDVPILDGKTQKQWLLGESCNGKRCMEGICSDIAPPPNQKDWTCLYKDVVRCDSNGYDLYKCKGPAKHPSKGGVGLYDFEVYGKWILQEDGCAQGCVGDTSYNPHASYSACSSGPCTAYNPEQEVCPGQQL